MTKENAVDMNGRAWPGDFIVGTKVKEVKEKMCFYTYRNFSVLKTVAPRIQCLKLHNSFDLSIYECSREHQQLDGNLSL